MSAELERFSRNKLTERGRVSYRASPFRAPWAGAGRARCAPRRPRWPPRWRGADLLLVHDPELLLVLPPRRGRPPTVWDVHEDTAAALTTKAWLPGWLRPAAAGGVNVAERLAERRLHLILAEHGYNAQVPRHPPGGAQHDLRPGRRRLRRPGHAASSTSASISPDRGSAEMVELARLLAPHGIAVELIGPADAAARAHIEAAGDLAHWHGFVPNAEALRLVEGALAGPVAAAGRGELPPLDADQGRRVHGAAACRW